MKWRIVPDLNLDKIQSQKVLVVGAGTLGCNVARGLLGWGITKIDFIDNGLVSHSNPVRQSLYNFSDVGKPKAETASASLKNINPAVQSHGYNFTIPMPGHSISAASKDKTRENLLVFENLVKEADAIFILVDSREARWLPTLLAKYHSKTIINVALGFDSFLALSGDSCYFCGDIVAPRDSLKDRTLDQQCTVTRPGLSMTACGYAVEQYISTLDDCFECCHHLRGSVDTKLNSKISSVKFDKCVACSVNVLESYREDGFDFIVKVCEDSNVIETICGIEKMIDNVEEIEEWDDD